MRTDAPDASNEYIKREARRIAATSELLKCLGLAKSDEQSKLGWKPTRLLLRIIANEATRPRAILEDRQTKEERAFLDSIVASVEANKKGEYDRSALRGGFHLLNAPGLLREDGNGDFIPTAFLHEIFSVSQSKPLV
jgi:hypothetical protein